MYIVTVELHVKPEKMDEFLKFSLDNAAASRREPGCLRFDVLRLESEPNRFLFFELYKSPDDLKAHQQTAHYHRWRDHVPDLLLEPRVGRRFVNVSPTDEAWSGAK